MDEGVIFTHLYNKGFKFSQIAKEMDISISKAKKLRSRLELPKRFSNLHPYRKKQVEEVAELYKGGSSTIIIADKLNITSETVRRILIKKGIKRRNTNGLNKDKIQVQNKIICDMYISGKKINNISEITDISKRAIFKRLNKLGIERNRKPHNEIGKVYDTPIKEFYSKGNSINEISNSLELTKSFVTYRLGIIFPEGTSYKIFYFSKLTNRWKKMNKVLNRIELDKQKKRLKMRLGYKPTLKIKIHIPFDNNFSSF